LAGSDKFVEISVADIAASNAVGRDTRLLRKDPGGELFRRHLERKKTYYRSVLGDSAAVGSVHGFVSFCRVERDVGSERRLSHRRSSSEDHKV
jgi:hypothetical protein